MQSKRHRTRTRVHCRAWSPRRFRTGRPKWAAPALARNARQGSPFPVSPRGKPGRGKFPPRRQHRSAPPARGFSKRSAENPLARSPCGHDGESVQSETMRAAKQEADVFPLAALCLLAENSHRGHRLSTAVLHQGFAPINSSTATSFQAFLYDEGRRSRSTGKERDTETGLDYFGARYFSGAQGRFTSPDWSAKPQPVPYANLQDPQTLNLYSYVRNNPLSKPDLDGHCLEDACVIEGAAVGTGVLYGGAAIAGAVGLTGVAVTLHNSGDAIISGAKSLIGSIGGLIFQSESKPEAKPASPSQTENQPAPTTATADTKPKSNPMTGEPGSTSTTRHASGDPKQVRRYGPDGHPETDVDHGHDHGQGDPHAHDWGRPTDGTPPTHVDRAPGRPLKPNDPQPQ